MQNRPLAFSFNLFLALVVLISSPLYSRGKLFSKEVLEVSQENPLPESSKEGGKTGHVFLSLVLPGAGQWGIGERGRAKFFLGAEALLWISYLATLGYRDVLQNDLQSFAAVNAGVNSADKNDQYWIDIGDANSMEEFNQQRLRDRDLESVYPEGQGYEWQWNSRESRLDYLNQRFNREDWKRTSTVFLAGIVLNHLISAIDVIRIIRKNESLPENRRQSLLQLNHTRKPLQGEVFELKFTWAM